MPYSGDVNIIGALPTDVQDAATRTPLSVRLYGLAWSHTHRRSGDRTLDDVNETAHDTGNTEHDEAIKIHCDASARIELTDTQSGLRWTAALLSSCSSSSSASVGSDGSSGHNRSPPVQVYSDKASSSDHALAPCVFIAANTWTTSTHVDDSMTYASEAKSSAGSSHATTACAMPSDANEATTLTIHTEEESADVTMVNALCTHSYTLSELLGSACAAHAELIRDMVQFLAPARRRVDEVVAYIFTESKRAACHRRCYSLADLQFLLNRLTIASSSRSDTLELKSVGYGWVDVEKFDSIRTRQQVANRAFLSLGQHRLLSHRADRNKDTVDSSDDEERVSGDVAWLGALERYVDRDILLSVRTGGGGIMAGLGNRAHAHPPQPSSSPQQHRPRLGVASQADTRDSCVVAGRAGKRSRSCSNDRDSEAEDEEEEKGTSHATAVHRLDCGGKQTRPNSSPCDVGRGCSMNECESGDARQADDITGVAAAPRAQPLMRPMRIHDMALCEVAWAEGDLGSARVTELVDRAAELILDAERVATPTCAADASDEARRQTTPRPQTETQAQRQSLWQGERLVYDAMSLRQVSSLYARLLETYTQMSDTLTRHAEVVREARAWCATYFRHKGTHELEQKMRSWSTTQAAIRTGLLAQYERLHSYLYTFEREITEYVAMCSYGLLCSAAS